ncbi:transcriptional regulator [Pseudomonas sp. GM21]|jgi:AcrR family transcriptional regulator|uniref:TetR/AcrR family transcriptional regulator n=1 Tax=Pseudomonas sp. GM21 TaxID=1144325 RepID=UPI00027253E2|nr:TetR family transcriptional regulator [Pseudomonas sp. GM21]EJM15526.1 transcriptional regulator [Pseudomonas sp. GM21]
MKNTEEPGSAATREIRTGRRKGSGSSRQAVLDAARARFASDGFAATTMRRVAADAGVDVSMVMQFFRSKDELFAAVMNIPESALEKLGAVFEGTDNQLGERVVRAFLQAWEGAPEESEPLMAMLRNAMVNEQARQHLRDYIESRLMTGGSESLGPDARLRAGLALSMLVGLVTGRLIIGVPVLAAADRETLVAMLAPAIQHTLLPGNSGATGTG